MEIQAFTLYLNFHDGLDFKIILELSGHFLSYLALAHCIL